MSSHYDRKLIRCGRRGNVILTLWIVVFAVQDSNWYDRAHSGINRAPAREISLTADTHTCVPPALNEPASQFDSDDTSELIKVSLGRKTRNQQEPRRNAGDQFDNETLNN